MGRLLRMLRIKRNWRQVDVGKRANASAAAVGRHENGRIGSIGALERHAGVFSLRVDVRLVGRSGGLVRLADEEHAAIAEDVATRLQRLGLAVDAEVSFSEWGERGRFDLLAYDPKRQMLVIVEVKTLLVDLQDLFGALDAKQRLAATVASKRGWTARRRVTVLAVASTATNRQTVHEHATLFGGFARRRLSGSFLAGADDRLLVWVVAPRSARQGWVAGRQRVRRGNQGSQLSTHEANARDSEGIRPRVEVPLTGREIGAWTRPGQS
jgi:transcriptional regulator with XRE-family HTH domain